MTANDIVLNVAERVERLRRLTRLPNRQLQQLQNLTDIAAYTFDAPAALTTLVFPDRQFHLAAHGLPPPDRDGRLGGHTEPPIHTYSICQFVVAANEPLIIRDAATDPLVDDLIAVTQPDGIKAYLGWPLRTPDHLPLGSFCVIDYSPRRWGDDDSLRLRDLAVATSAVLLYSDRY